MNIGLIPACDSLPQGFAKMPLKTVVDGRRANRHIRIRMRRAAPRLPTNEQRMDILEVASTTADKLTSLTIDYVFEGKLLGSFELTGGKAEYGPAMLKAFLGFLYGCGITIDADTLMNAAAMLP